MPIGRKESGLSELNNSYKECDESPLSKLLGRYREQCSTNGGMYCTSTSVRSFSLQPNFLASHDDYINERSPEGSDQFIANTMPTDKPDSNIIPSDQFLVYFLLAIWNGS